MADLDTADDTMAVDAATAAAPIPASELAWSADLSVDDLALPRPWHAVQRTALGIFAVCIAIAGGVTVADRHWFSELRAESTPAAVQVIAPAPTTSAAPSTEEPAPRLPPVPAAEHLVPPAPDPLTTSTAEQDALFFAGLTASGIVVYDRNDAMDTGHYVCQARASGLSRMAIATMAVSRNPRLSPRDATNLVLVSINAYCPGY